jgi:hypothetical protein
MDSGIWVIASLVFSLVCAVGPMAALIALFPLLNHRDRRQARLLSLVAEQFPGEVLRSDIVIAVRCPLLFGGGIIRVDVRHDGGEVRPAIERLGRALPPRVRLVVTGDPRPDHTGHRPRGAASSEAPATLVVVGDFAGWEARGENGLAAAGRVSTPPV